MRDYSFFSDVKRLRDNFAILEVTNRRNRRVLDQLDVRDTEIEYFGLSVADGEITYLGSTKNLKEPKTSISLIPEGLILSRNGAVYFVSRWSWIHISFRIRLLESNGYISPAEYEEAFHSRKQTHNLDAVIT